MDIKIGLPLSFSEIGQKDNQEDFVFPSPTEVKQDDRVIILCDGMGGHSHGEVASRTVATALGQFMKWHFPSDGILTKELFNEGLNYAYGQLNLVDDGAPKKMGTTLTFVCFHKGGCFCAHIGDSRIYIVRPSERRIVYRSEDHSLVNDLVRAGELTSEEAASYPHKNVITRAMQPNQEKPAKAEIRIIQDIQSGDYVFQCCDGILENLTDDELVDILSDPATNDVQKLAAIKNVCFGRTKDNFTCYLTPIKSVSQDVDVFEPSTLSAKHESEDDELDAPANLVPSPNKSLCVLFRPLGIKAKGWVWGVVILVLLLLFILVARSAYKRGQQSKQDNVEQLISPEKQDNLNRSIPGNESKGVLSRKTSRRHRNQQQ